MKLGKHIYDFISENHFDTIQIRFFMTIRFTTSIRELFKMGIITPRCNSSCVINGIDNVRDLDYHYSPDSGFQGLRNCGPKINQQLTDVLMQAHSGNIEDCASNFVEALPSSVAKVIHDSIAEVFPPEEKSAPVNSFYALFSAHTFIYLVYKEREKILARTRLISTHTDRKTQAVQLSQLRKGIVKVISNSLDIFAGSVDNGVRQERTLLKKIKNALETSYRLDYVADFYAAHLSEGKMRLAEKQFELLTEEMPRIAHNFMRKNSLSLAESWSLLNIDEDEFFRSYPTSRKGGIGFLQMLGKFKKYLDKLITSSDEDDACEEIRSEFEFLSEEEATKVVNFFNEHGTYPMFFICDRYFATTKLRQHKIFANCFGLGGYKALKKTEVAEALGVSRERVRQILSDSDFSRLPFSDNKFWKHYGWENTDFFSYKSARWRAIMIQEGLPPVFTAFAGIMVGVNGFIFKRMAGVDKFIVKSDKFESYSRYLKTMLDMRDRAHVEDITLKLSELMDCKDYKEERMRETVLSELAGYLELETFGETVFFPHNTVDVAAEVENMLRRQGDPLHIDEILDRMSSMFPDLELSKERLKFQMRRSDEIVPRGKTSMYCLKSWTHVFIGGIRDLVKQILSEHSLPVDMSEIMEKVSEHFDTNRYNVYNSLLICDDFILFEGGCFGLVGKEYPSIFQPCKRTIPRKSFAERMKDYREFVELNGHHPYNSGEYEEEALKRWQVNVMKEFIATLPSEKKELADYLEETRHLPFSAVEYLFKRACESYSHFYHEYGCAPDSQSDPELSKWFKKQLKLYQDYTDLRKTFFESLLEELNSSLKLNIEVVSTN